MVGRVPGAEGFDNTNFLVRKLRYTAEMVVYAKSLANTYGREKVQFLYAQPTGSLVEGIIAPRIAGAKMVAFEQWPESLKNLAAEMAQIDDPLFR